MPRYFSSDKHNLIHGWKILALIVVSLATGAWKAFSFKSSTALFIRKAFRSSRNTRSINGNLHYQSKTLLLMSQQPLNETALAPANLAAVDPFEDWKLKKKSSTGIIPAGPDALASIEKAEGLPDDEYQKPKDRTGATKFFKIVDSLAPNEMLLKFAQSAPRNVQEAAKSTIVTILGSLPNYALDAALITTSSKLANLLYQMQMTGYMFKNAEYRMSLTKSLKGLPKLPETTKVAVSNSSSVNPLDKKLATVKGQVTVTSTTGESVVVDVEELTSALSREIADLRSELSVIRNERENELKSNLLTYIQALPEKELLRLTADMSDDVLVSIQMLVDALMGRLGIDSSTEVVIQQSVGQLAQLCMWSMVVGYKLRELEALEKGGAALD